MITSSPSSPSSPSALAVTAVTDHAFTAAVLECERPVVVDFWAPWCGPCRVMAPIFTELAQAWPHVRFVKVDIDEQQLTAARYHVLSAPTLIVFRAGQPVLTLVGSRPRRRLERELAAVVG